MSSASSTHTSIDLVAEKDQPSDFIPMHIFIYRLEALIKGKKNDNTKELRDIVKSLRKQYPHYNHHVEHMKASDLLAYNCNQLDGQYAFFQEDEMLSERELSCYSRSLKDILKFGGTTAIVLVALLFTPKELSHVDFNEQKFAAWWKTVEVPEALRKDVALEADMSEIKMRVVHAMDPRQKSKQTKKRRIMFSLRRPKV